MKQIYFYIILVVISMQSAIAGYLDTFHADKVSNHVYVINGPL